jgi:FdhD protein
VHTPVTVSVGASEARWEIAAEVPVQIMVNGAPFTVMLATPADVEDLARGLLITEQVITRADAIEHIDVASWLGDVQVMVQVAPDGLRRERLGARSVLGNSGCGVCGIDSLAQLHGRQLPMRAECVAVSDEAVRRAFADLPAHQPLNASTHSVHAAAWCDLTGHVVLAREDVGRHNALDKLVGALAQSHRLHEPGFVVMSSRCSYELVYKAAATNAQLLATISAPTTMALQWSAALSVPLASALRRGDRCDVVRFPASSHPFLTE